MTKFIKLDREITEADVGKLVRKRNGEVEEIKKFSPNTPQPVYIIGGFKSVKGFTFSEDDPSEYDIIEIEDTSETVQEPFEFRVGDIVDFGGMRGEITETDIYSYHYVLRVQFDNASNIAFTKDGRFHIDQTKPVITLIERPKKKVKKTIKQYGYINKDNLTVDNLQGLRYFDSPMSYGNDYQEIILTGEVEVEE